ncbi:MAG: hypothetical protein QW579_04705 [Desulfurococcaceae archaeon]
MALPTSPATGQTEEGEIKQFVLFLDEIKITIIPSGVIIESGGRKVADLSWREWRVFKTFIDNIYAELRAALRG